MNEEDSVEDVPVETSGVRWLLPLLALYLIGTFLWRAFVPAHEFPSIGLRNLSIGLDLLCLVCLVGLQIQRSRKQQPVSSGSNLLFWIALLAGLGLFAIRLNATESFWTGHIKYGLLPRSTRQQTPKGTSKQPANTGADDTRSGSNTGEPAANDSPSAVYKAFYAAYNNKDDETMKTLISRGEFRMLDFADKNKANERNDQTLRKVLQQPMGPNDNTRNEKITGETATVECFGPKDHWYTRTFLKEDGK